MKKLIICLAVALAAFSADAQHIGRKYELKKVIEVKGRQGSALLSCVARNINDL